MFCRIAVVLFGCGVLAASLPAGAQDGTLDHAFGYGNGFRGISYSGLDTSEDDFTDLPAAHVVLRARTLLVQPDGRIIYGVGYHPHHNDPGVLEMTRTLPDGSVDDSLTAQAVTGLSIASGPASMGLQSNGKVIVLAYGYAGNANDFVVFRYNSDGSLDGNWGSSGCLDVSYTLVPAVSVTPTDVLVQTDDKVIITGTATTSAGVSYFVALRLTKDGLPDNGYGSDNNGQIVVTRFGVLASAPPTEVLHHARLSAKGNLFLGGWTQPNSNGGIFDPPLNKASIAIAKLTSAGALDGSFGNGGVVVYNLNQVGSLGATDIALTRNEGVYALTNATSVVRFLKNGGADPAFGGGIATFTPLDPLSALALPTVSYALAVQEQDGKVVIAGQSDSSGGKNYAMAARLLTNGSPDPEFGTANSGTGVFLQNTNVGNLPFEEGGVIAQQSGQIIIGGKVQHGDYAVYGINYIPIIYRLRVDRIFYDGGENSP